MISPVEQIKERLSIEEVVSSYIKLDRAGANLKAKCPFHNEKTPSFFVSPDRNSFYCFGCGAKGDIFTFVEEFEGLDFKGALKILAEKAGVSLSGWNKEKEGEKERLYKAMEESAKFFEKNLWENKEVLDYLKKRGLEEKTIKNFRIGFIKDDWRLLYSHLIRSRFTDAEIEKAGLSKKAEGNSSGEQRFYDRFRGRIMFPISDSSGRIIAFSGRIFHDDGKSAKYLNSPETPIFNKSSILYGLDKAKDSIRKNNFSILVEGQMDLVLSHQAGWRNTVATSGTALSDSTVSRDNVVSNLGLLRRLSQNIVLAFDADKAGWNASMRAGSIALSLGMDVKAVSLPDGIDPADLISGVYSQTGDVKNGSDAWRASIRNSKHIILFLLDKVLRDCKDDSRKAGREIKEKVLPYVNAVSSSIEKDDFLKKISSISGIREEALREDLAKIEKETKAEKEEIKKADEKKSALFRKDYIERRLLGIIFWQKSLGEKSILDVSGLEKELAKFLGEKIEDLFSRNEKDKEDLIFEAEVFYGKEEKLEDDAKELLINLEEEYLKEDLSKKMYELHIAEENKDLARSSSILKECQILNNKIQNIRSGRFK